MVTDGMSDAVAPAWDRGGNHLGIAAAFGLLGVTRQPIAAAALLSSARVPFREFLAWDGPAAGQGEQFLHTYDS